MATTETQKTKRGDPLLVSSANIKQFLATEKDRIDVEIAGNIQYNAGEAQ
jgi:hypothetical protein